VDHRRTLGAAGEDAAARHLEQRGARIVERNFRTRYGELDIVAVDGDALVFCEVKARLGGTTARALEAVTPLKQLRLRKMAGEWFRSRPGGAARTRSVRFDAIGVVVSTGGRVLALEHLIDAF
jgi:putative endonuclease